MFERISNGLKLAKQSYRVLMLDKELLVFPLLSGVACLIVLASFAIPLWNSDLLSGLEDNPQGKENILAYVVMFLFYFVNYFVILFFNAALIACAIIRFGGGDPTLGDGFRAAGARLPQIAAWALVSATVGMILKIIESRSEKVGQIVSGLLGMAWSIVTYFVVPALVVEKIGPIAAVKRSTSIIRRTWGEALTANVGISLAVFLAFLVACVPGVLGGVISVATESPIALIVGVVVSILLMIVISLASTAMHAISLAALYIYAAKGEIPEHFDGQLLKSAFGKKA